MAEYTYIKPAVLGAVTVINLLSNSLVIGVLLRYPQLREDRNALFILSMSFSDIGSGLFNIFLSAGLCSSASTFLLREHPYLPTVIGFAMWWFSLVSLYSLCWLILSKNIAIAMPFRSDQLLSRTRCHSINGLTWLVGFCISAVLFADDMEWNLDLCSYNYPGDSTLTIYYLIASLFTLVLPRVLLIWGTVRIIIIFMRTHRQIAAQTHSVTDSDVAAPTSGTITAQTLRSSINVIVICIVSILLTTPIVVYVIHSFAKSQVNSSVYGFGSVWVFHLNTVANGVLYLIIFRSVRKKTTAMVRDMLICIRGS